MEEDFAKAKPYAASMGIYVFKKQVLLDLLEKQFPNANDFSRDILSFKSDLKIVAYRHNKYWEDVGSLKDYYYANLALATDVSSESRGGSMW